VKAPIGYPRLIQPARFARNGLIPEWGFAKRCVDAHNHVHAYRRKCLLTWSDWQDVGAGSAGTVAALRFRFHSGHGATYLAFRFALALDTTHTGVNPGVQVAVKIVGGATTTATLYAGASNTSEVDTPSNVAWRNTKVALTGDTDYEVTISTVDYGRIFSALSYEIANDSIDSGTGYPIGVDPTIGTPIIHSLRKAQIENASWLWRHNASQLLTWPGAYPSADPTYASLTWTNVIDAATAIAASSAGWKPTNSGDMGLWTRAGSNVLNVVIAAMCSVAGGATGEVRLQDGTGTRCSITAMGTAAAWYTLATTISAVDTIDKLDLQARVSNALHTMTLHAVSVYAYLA
jgi:hypothetical protein